MTSCTRNPRETDLHPKFSKKSSRYRSSLPFAPQTQGRPIFTLSFRRNRLGIEPVDLLHCEPKESELHSKFKKKSSRYRTRRAFAPGTQERPIYTLSLRRSRLDIEAVNLLHQEPKVNRLNTPSFRRSRLGIEAVEFLHQEPKGDRLTP